MAVPTSVALVAAKLIFLCLLVQGDVHTRVLAQALTPATICTAAFANVEGRLAFPGYGIPPCVPANSCPTSFPTTASVLFLAPYNYETKAVPIGTFVADKSSLSDCCAECSAQRATCGAFQYSADPANGPVGCYLLSASDCTAQFHGLILGFLGTTYVGSSAAFCPEVAKPPCKSVTLIAGADNTAPTPTASDVYDTSISQLAPGEILNPLTIDYSSSPPATLYVGTHSYVLTASKLDHTITSESCSGTITVVESTTTVAALCATAIENEERRLPFPGYSPAPCVPANTCPSDWPSFGSIIFLNRASGRALGTLVPGKDFYNECCSECNAQKATCGAFQFSANPVYGTVGCYLLGASECGAIKDRSATLTQGYLPGSSYIGFSAARCPEGVTAPVSTPDCKPLTLTAGVDCTAPTPAASDLYDNSKSPLPPGLTLTRTIDGSSNPPETLAVGTHAYALTASNSDHANSDPCLGTITVQAAPFCKATVSFPATANCAADIPDPKSLYDGTPNPTSSLTLAIEKNPTSLLVGTHSYTLIASNICGQQSSSCTGSIIVQDTEPFDSSLLNCPGTSTINPGGSFGALTANYWGGTSKANGCKITITVPDVVAGSAVTCDRCNKPGRHESPGCKATVSGNKLTVTESGGVGNYISWSVKATDGQSTVAKSCGVCVENPGKGGVCKAGWQPGTPAPCGG